MDLIYRKTARLRSLSVIHACRNCIRMSRVVQFVLGQENSIVLQGAAHVDKLNIEIYFYLFTHLAGMHGKTVPGIIFHMTYIGICT